MSPRDPPGSYLAALGLHADTTLSDDFYVSSKAQTQLLLLANQALYQLYSHTDWQFVLIH